MASNIVITFKQLAEESLEQLQKEGRAYVIELDDEKNNGKTTFYYGDTAFFKVYGIETPSIASTDGTITSHGRFIENVKEKVEFIDSAEASLRKPILTLNSYKYFGKSTGNISRNGYYGVKAENVNYKTGNFAVAEIDYQTQYFSYSITLSEKPDEEYPIIVIVY